ncbi:hypothetical protein [Algoriphagus faecimaris]|uniref:hypothetical protein n=1 Tax=Algoriphagus faecimaris TaxID=686796 RepID=UPI00146A02FD|nr:hypothetical protein [Algoriphagus faecimaris]
MRTVGVARVELELGTIQEMNSLYDQMEGNAPGTMRIWRYEEANLPKKRAISWSWSTW